MTAPARELADTATLQALLVRVQGAKGADRELDSIIFEWERPELELSADMWGSYYGECTGEYFSEGQVIAKAPPYTASLDATLELVERVLPGVWWITAKGKLREAEPLYGVQLKFGADETISEGEHEANPCLAMLSALLRAKIAEAG